MARPVSRTHCKDCGIKLDELNTVWDNPQNKRPRCRECHCAYMKAYRDKDKGATSRRNRQYNLKKLYDITPEVYDRLFIFQQGGCAICRMSSDVLHVDHNHETGEIRGLLCHSCNLMLGFSKEDENIIWNMLEYLKRTTWKKEVA